MSAEISNSFEAAAVAPAASWGLAHGVRILLDRPRLMAILNLTPDSFFAGSRVETPHVTDIAKRAVDDGADMLDLGGESTRPGSAAVSDADQLARVLPAVRAIRSAGGPLCEIPISIDTTRAGVADACLHAGANAINDVSAGLDDPNMLGTVARHKAGLVLMHRVKPPAEDQYADRYDVPPLTGDVVAAVGKLLHQRVEAAIAAGVPETSLLIDPGLGFGKSVDQNLELIDQTPRLIERVRRPVLSALSRKSFVGRVSLQRDSDPSERLAGSLALSVTHMHRGASIYRVHDVAPHAEALRAAWACSRRS